MEVGVEGSIRISSSWVSMLVLIGVIYERRLSLNKFVKITRSTSETCKNTSNN